MAPGGTMVSLFRSSTAAPVVARMTMLLPRANPRFAPVSITRTSGQHRAASALPSADWLSTTTISCDTEGAGAWSDSRQRSRSARALKLTMMIERSGISRRRLAPALHEDTTEHEDREGFECEDLRARPLTATNPKYTYWPAFSITASVSRAARGQSYLASVTGAAAISLARVFGSKSASSSARAVPARSPAPTYNAASPQLSRATAVSRSTGGTPAASPSSGVRPSPSYSDRNANARARA